MIYNDVYLDNDFTRETYAQPTISTTVLQPVIGGTIITTINGTTGPAINLDGGTTGLAFTGGMGNITLSGTLVIANGGTGATTAAGARTNLGLGTIATQDASNVTITGGSVTGITDLAIADGGTGASTTAAARTNLSVPRVHIAAAAPAVTDDGLAGFPTGTLWVDTTGDDAYISVDDTDDAAIWLQITP